MGFSLSEIGGAEMMMLFGGVLTIGGSVLPWATSMNSSISGLDGDGHITLGLGLLIAALALSQYAGRAMYVGAMFVGLNIFVVGINTYWNMGNLGLMYWPGMGLYLTMGAAAFIMGGGAIGFAKFTVNDGNAQAAS